MLHAVPIDRPSVDQVLDNIARYSGDPVVARAAARLKGQPVDVAIDAFRNLRHASQHHVNAALHSLRELQQ